MQSFRGAALTSLAALLVLSLASIASGETASGAGDGKGGGAARSPRTTHKPARTKKKKQKRSNTTLTPRSTSRLTLAAGTDLGTSSEPLVDESRLPPPSSGSCPPEMASIDHRYCIDRWEASTVEIAADGDRPFSPFQIVDGHDVRAASAPGVFPQGYVSGTQAQAACGLAGKRLCSPMEWRKACVGPDTRLYGYSSARERGRCNDTGRSPMLAVWGQGALASPTDWDPLKMNDPRLNQLDGSLARTGAHPDCTNGYGVYDMVGNLHEWTSDPDGTFQGGYYLDTTLNGEGCAYRTTAHDFSYHDYSTGFRCCADPR